MASGDPVSVLPRLWKEFGATHLTFEEDETLEPYALKRDKVRLLIYFRLLSLHQRILCSSWREMPHMMAK